MLEELNLYAVKVDIKVLWSDMDISQQVNSTRFFSWFEVARVEYFIRLGLDIIDNDEEPGFRVKQQSIVYQTPVNFPDTIVIGIRAICMCAVSCPAASSPLYLLRTCGHRLKLHQLV